MPTQYLPWNIGKLGDFPQKSWEDKFNKIISRLRIRDWNVYVPTVILPSGSELSFC